MKKRAIEKGRRRSRKEEEEESREEREEVAGNRRLVSRAPPPLLRLYAGKFSLPFVNPFFATLPKLPFSPVLFSDIGRALALRPCNYGIVSRNGRVPRIFVQQNGRRERRRP